MTVELPISGMVILIHVAIFLSSLRDDGCLCFWIAIFLVMLGLGVRALPALPLTDRVTNMQFDYIFPWVWLLFIISSFLVYLWVNPDKQKQG